MPDDAWDLVFKPEYISKLKSCGVSFLDSATDIIPAAAHYLGKPGFSKNPADYAGVPALLKTIRPYVTVFSSSGYINDLANGAICVALGWSGDINIAKNRAIEGKTGQKIECLIPKSGAIIFMDTMAIPADAPHPGNAHKWIDYYLRPEVSASMTNKVLYPNPNKESLKFVKPAGGQRPHGLPPRRGHEEDGAAGRALQRLPPGHHPHLHHLQDRPLSHSPAARPHPEAR